MHSLSLIGALLLCVFLFGLVRPSLAQTPPKPRTDDDPRTVIELYFQAHALGKAEFIEQAFTPDAKIKFVDAGELKSGRVTSSRNDSSNPRRTNTAGCAASTG
jgi:hypothetical protein